MPITWYAEHSVFDYTVFKPDLGRRRNDGTKEEEWIRAYCATMEQVFFHQEDQFNYVAVIPQVGMQNS